jgi:hypothetical protein
MGRNTGVTCPKGASKRKLNSNISMIRMVFNNMENVNQYGTVVYGTRYSTVVGPDPHHFLGSRPGSASRAWIRIWPIRIGINTGHMKKLINHTFSQKNFNMLNKLLKIMTSLTLTRKIKHCKLAKL